MSSQNKSQKADSDEYDSGDEAFENFCRQKNISRIGRKSEREFFDDDIPSKQQKMKSLEDISIVENNINNNQIDQDEVTLKNEIFIMSDQSKFFQIKNNFEKESFKLQSLIGQVLDKIPKENKKYFTESFNSIINSIQGSLKNNTKQMHQKHKSMSQQQVFKGLENDQNIFRIQQLEEQIKFLESVSFKTQLEHVRRCYILENEQLSQENQQQLLQNEQLKKDHEKQLLELQQKFNNQIQNRYTGMNEYLENVEKQVKQQLDMEQQNTTQLLINQQCKIENLQEQLNAKDSIHQSEIKELQKQCQDIKQDYDQKLIQYKEKHNEIIQNIEQQMLNEKNSNQKIENSQIKQYELKSKNLENELQQVNFQQQAKDFEIENYKLQNDQLLLNLQQLIIDHQSMKEENINLSQRLNYIVQRTQKQDSNINVLDLIKNFKCNNSNIQENLSEKKQKVTEQKQQRSQTTHLPTTEKSQFSQDFNIQQDIMTLQKQIEFQQLNQIEVNEFDFRLPSKKSSQHSSHQKQSQQEEQQQNNQLEKNQIDLEKIINTQNKQQNGVMQQNSNEVSLYSYEITKQSDSNSNQYNLYDSEQSQKNTPPQSYLGQNRFQYDRQNSQNSNTEGSDIVNYDVISIDFRGLRSGMKQMPEQISELNEENSSYQLTQHIRSNQQSDITVCLEQLQNKDLSYAQFFRDNNLIQNENQISEVKQKRSGTLEQQPNVKSFNHSKQQSTSDSPQTNFNFQERVNELKKRKDELQQTYDEFIQRKELYKQQNISRVCSQRLTNVDIGVEENVFYQKPKIRQTSSIRKSVQFYDVVQSSPQKKQSMHQNKKQKLQICHLACIIYEPEINQYYSENKETEQSSNPRDIYMDGLNVHLQKLHQQMLDISEGINNKNSQVKLLQLKNLYKKADRFMGKLNDHYHIIQIGLLQKTLQKFDFSTIQLLRKYNYLNLEIKSYEIINPTQNPYVEYTIEIIDVMIQKFWQFKSRYSNISKFNDYLVSNLKQTSDSLPTFPSKKLFSNKLSSQFIEKRIEELNHFFQQTIVNEDILNSGIIKDFIYSGLNRQLLESKDSMDQNLIDWKIINDDPSKYREQEYVNGMIHQVYSELQIKMQKKFDDLQRDLGYMDQNDTCMYLHLKEQDKFYNSTG